MLKRDLFRIIDANFNRSREGLRVCEEVARFVWNSKPLTEDLKTVRHSITDILKKSPAPAKILFETRDVISDVGRDTRRKSEMRRLGYPDIFSANIERVKESLRVLEEFFKLVDKSDSAKFTKLRFKVYEIEKKALSRLR
ncbi:MAG: thiamine-phosphate pyrophosphorylase [Candidatus Omnitrophota bacterium]|jgi:thiamine-phosphate pyrophosphorylase|nr:thiamine-phosphate pyrophosphorylase [Candidatus Omnitrophota bacterium]